MPDIYLITGGTGAGKTTYSRQLAADVGAVRFSIDDWMTSLFWMDSPDPISFDWAMSRINRAEAQMWETAQQILAANVSVIFDLGFTKRAHRQKFRDLAKIVNLPVLLHWLDIGKRERWHRVQSRNQEKGITFAMTVTVEMFEFMENEWESPASETHTKVKA